MASETVSAPLAIPVEPTTPMRPSEAMRLGCLLAPEQAFATFGEGLSACAVGAMTAAVEGFAAEGGYAPIDGEAARLYSATAELDCPFACGGDFRHAVEHLNDDHRMTRERIADWLAGLGL